MGENFFTSSNENLHAVTTGLEVCSGDYVLAIGSSGINHLHF